MMEDVTFLGMTKKLVYCWLFTDNFILCITFHHFISLFIAFHMQGHS